MALGLEEREHHAAADDEAVGLVEQVVDDAELVGDLRAAEDDRVRTFGAVGEPLEDRDLGLDESTDRGGQAGRDVVDACLLAVHDSESVGHEDIGEVGELIGEGAAYVVVLAGLTGVEAHVLEDRDVAVTETGDDVLGVLADRVGREEHLRVDQIAQTLGDRSQRVLRIGRTVGTAQVRHHDDAGAGVDESLDRGDAGPDASVIGNDGAVQGHVEVTADEYAFAAQVAQVRNRLHGQSDEPTCATRSTRRLE